MTWQASRSVEMTCAAAGVIEGTRCGAPYRRITVSRRETALRETT
jgi:hypothetical protein